jgi:hypothetical protein
MPIVRRTRIFKTACGVCLVVLAAVVWSWDVSSVRTLHSVLKILVLLTMDIIMPETC